MEIQNSEAGCCQLDFWMRMRIVRMWDRGSGFLVGVLGMAWGGGFGHGVLVALVLGFGFGFGQ